VAPLWAEASFLLAFEVGFVEVVLVGRVVFCIGDFYGICNLFCVRLVVYDVVLLWLEFNLSVNFKGKNITSTFCLLMFWLGFALDFLSSVICISFFVIFIRDPFLEIITKENYS